MCVEVIVCYIIVVFLRHGVHCRHRRHECDGGIRLIQPRTGVMPAESDIPLSAAVDDKVKQIRVRPVPATVVGREVSASLIPNPNIIFVLVLLYLGLT